LNSKNISASIDLKEKRIDGYYENYSCNRVVVATEEN
jgi:hypothetical protein